MEDQTTTGNNKSATPEEQPKTTTENSPAKTGGGKGKPGRPARQEKEPPQWTIRGVDIETRNIISKAIEKRGVTVGQFFNQDVREFATGIIKRSGLPPATTQDVEDMVNSKLAAFAESLKPQATTNPEELAQITAAAVIKLLETKTTQENTTFLQRLAAVFKH